MDDRYDIIVVGGGHTGIEAAYAASKFGMNVMLAAIRRDRIGWMPCNPSIGGPAKGHLTREIDALGGLQGIVTDKTSIHVRWLNTKKGPAVRALRAQCDKPLYARTHQEILSSIDNITIREGTVTDLISDGGKITGVRFSDGENFSTRAVILATGTFLGGVIYRGDERIAAGREGEGPAAELSVSLRQLGIPLARLKTGTVPRVFRDSVDYKSMEVQQHDESCPGFSYMTVSVNELAHLPCYITHTTPETRTIIQSSLDRAALFSGDITGEGPRYCPSIEDKYRKFPDKISHPVFLEPEAAIGELKEEIYLQGLSTSLPADVQNDYIHSVPGLENARVARYGYAIEYDYVDPLEVHSWGVSKKYPNLYLAGQILGTTGYEEAAALGLMAGLNASRYLLDQDPVVLRRDQAYIGVMTDDLATRGVSDPYRMLTGRAEWRLLLRFDDADRRLTPLGRELGLVDNERWEKYRKREDEIGSLTELLKESKVSVDTVINTVEGEAPQIGKEPSVRTLSEWLKVPGITLEGMVSSGLVNGSCDLNTIMTVESEIKYSGYLQRQQGEVKRLSRAEHVRIPENFNFTEIQSISRESREKLDRVRPRTLGQAGRISGVKPSDIAVLDILLAGRNKNDGK